MKFKIGDRVRVYYEAHENTGEVTGVPPIQGLNRNQLYVKCANGGALVPHYRQCRLLKKKERRRVWIPRDSLPGPVRDSGCNVFSCPPVNCDAVEFIEVRKKK